MTSEYGSGPNPEDPTTNEEKPIELGPEAAAALAALRNYYESSEDSTPPPKEKIDLGKEPTLKLPPDFGKKIEELLRRHPIIPLGKQAATDTLGGMVTLPDGSHRYLPRVSGSDKTVSDLAARVDPLPSEFQEIQERPVPGTSLDSTGSDTPQD